MNSRLALALAAEIGADVRAIDTVMQQQVQRIMPKVVEAAAGLTKLEQRLAELDRRLDGEKG